MKKVLLVIPVAVVICLLSCSFKPSNEEGGIKWMTWKEMQAAQKKQPRKVVVDVYTDWCGWCKKMDQSTFRHPDIVKYVNDNFYAVKFDAEAQETFSYKGRDYKFIPQGMKGYNELAAEMLNNQMGYPTTVYFDEAMNEIFPVPGYQDSKMFESVINYVASNSYKTTNFDEYQKTFKGAIK